MSLSTSSQPSNQALLDQTDVLHLIARDLHNPDERQDVDKRLADALEHPDFEKRAMGNLEHLRQTIEEIKRNFKIARDELAVFDSKDYKDTSGNVIKLHDRWSGYGGQFLVLMRDSRAIARNAVKELDKYYSTILNNPSESLTNEQVVSKLGILKERCEVYHQQIHPTIVGFQTLANDVGAYTGFVNYTAQAVRDQTASHISQLQSALEEMPNQFYPARYHVIVMTSSLIGFSTQVQSISAELSAELHWFDWISHHLGPISETATAITDCQSKINIINSIWLVIQKDVVELKSKINKLSEPNANFGTFWKKRLNGSRLLCEVLIKMLRTYADESENC